MVKKTNIVASIEKQLKALHALQIIDTKIDKIRILRGELPLEIDDLEDQISGLKTRLENFSSEFQVIKETIASHKNTIGLSKEAIDKYETQLKDIKNNREYTSLIKEIEYQNIEMQIAEKKIAQNDANLIHKKEIIDSCKLQISERKAELKLKSDELDQIIAETEKEEKRLLKDSEKASKVIDERLLNGYTKIRSKAANGLAVVSVERDACGGCFSQIPPQMQLDIQLHKKVTVCEHCGRILVDASILDAQQD
tara:strand:+ start:174 stop:932 length:759 start_codon:yes stop_codon:yes gene_type:complete